MNRRVLFYVALGLVAVVSLFGAIGLAPTREAAAQHTAWQPPKFQQTEFYIYRHDTKCVIGSSEQPNLSLLSETSSAASSFDTADPGDASYHMISCYLGRGPVGDRYEITYTFAHPYNGIITGRKEIEYTGQDMEIVRDSRYKFGICPTPSIAAN